MGWDNIIAVELALIVGPGALMYYLVIYYTIKYLYIPILTIFCYQ